MVVATDVDVSDLNPAVDSVDAPDSVDLEARESGDAVEVAPIGEDPDERVEPSDLGDGVPAEYLPPGSRDDVADGPSGGPYYPIGGGEDGDDVEPVPPRDADSRVRVPVDVVDGPIVSVDERVDSASWDSDGSHVRRAWREPSVGSGEDRSDATEDSYVSAVRSVDRPPDDALGEVVDPEADSEVGDVPVGVVDPEAYAVVAAPGVEDAGDDDPSVPTGRREEVGGDLGDGRSDRHVRAYEGEGVHVVRRY